MNLPQSFAHEPTGAGIRWLAAHMGRPKVRSAVPLHIPVFGRPERGTEPKLRAPYAVTLWKIICETKKPLTKATWMDAAGIHGKSERTNGASAIVNLLGGKWVRQKDGYYWRA